MIIGYVVIGIAFIIAGLCCATVFVKGDTNNVDTDTDNYNE